MIAWRMLRELIPTELISKINESDLKLTLTNNSIIELRGCDTPDSLRGVGVSFVVVDEYASIPNAEELWGEVLRPMLIDTHGRALFIGTPKGLNHFYTLYQKGINGESGFKSYRFTSYDNPFLSAKEIDEMRKELPERMFQQEVLTSFLVSSQNILIKIEDVEALKGNQMFEDENISHISCDPATVGGDECVLLAMDNTRIIEQKLLNYDDTQKIAVEIVALTNKYKSTGISIDSVGIGKGVADSVSNLVRDRDIKVLHISSGEKSDDKRFTNRRTEMWWYLWDKIKNKKVEYINDLELKRQLSSVEYKVIGEDKIALVPKKNTKSMLGRSPDRADAFVYGLGNRSYNACMNQM